MSDAMNAARELVDEFEDIFGDLSATEGDWLARRIADAIQARANREREACAFAARAMAGLS